MMVRCVHIIPRLRFTGIPFTHSEVLVVGRVNYEMSARAICTNTRGLNRYLVIRSRQYSQGALVVRGFVCTRRSTVK